MAAVIRPPKVVLLLSPPTVRGWAAPELVTRPEPASEPRRHGGALLADLLIEHGNRYDAWNAVDYDGLRQIASWIPGATWLIDFACPGCSEQLSQSFFSALNTDPQNAVGTTRYQIT